MKVVVRGKCLTEANIAEFIRSNMNIMIIGTAMKSAQGLDERDIDCLMKQMQVDRNSAVDALHKNGTLMDAIIELGNK